MYQLAFGDLDRLPTFFQQNAAADFPSFIGLLLHNVHGDDGGHDLHRVQVVHSVHDQGHFVVDWAHKTDKNPENKLSY